MLSTQADKVMIFISLQAGSSIEMVWLKYRGSVPSFEKEVQLCYFNRGVCLQVRFSLAISV